MLRFDHSDNEFICYSNDIIVGWLDYEHMNNNIHINTIYVYPTHRNKKIATKLLNLCLATFKQNTFSLKVAPFRDAPMHTGALKNFYYKFNFVEDTYNKNYLKLNK